MSTAMTRRFVACFAACALLSGCATLPRDPDGSLERIRAERVLRVGASPSEGRVALAEGRVTGPEADLAVGFAREQGAEVTWIPGGEEGLVTAMEDGQVDLLIGGLSDQTPWSDRVSVTRPYAEAQQGEHRVKHVMAVPLGENALLVALETYLDRRKA